MNKKKLNWGKSRYFDVTCCFNEMFLSRRIEAYKIPAERESSNVFTFQNSIKANSSITLNSCRKFVNTELSTVVVINNHGISNKEKWSWKPKRFTIKQIKPTIFGFNNFSNHICHDKILHIQNCQFLLISR